MKNYLIPILVIIALLSGYYFFTDPPKQDMTYQQRVDDFRLEKAFFLRSDPESPFSPASEFKKLNYFPVSEDFKVTADFLPVDDIVKVQVPTTDGKIREYFRYGYLLFDLKGESQKLLVYKSVDANNGELFLGFSDPTNGETTYGGGRYLDMNHSGQNQLILDFNFSYNPYCAYNPDYSCPIPPRENRITVPVEAGEMNYTK